MRIGILTLPFNNNYGGYLQAYALMTVLKQMGHEVELIYRRHNIKPLPYRIKDLIKTIIKFALGRNHGSIITNQEEEYKKQGALIMSFVDKHISPKTKPLYSTSELIHECHERYDMIVVGSDQVWRPDYVPNIENFFLDFVQDEEIAKIAYAASFGNNKPNYSLRQKQECGRLIEKFDMISVREESGVDVIKSMDWKTPNEPIVVLDPTMLLSRSHYESLLPAVKESKNYLLSYILDDNVEVRELIENVCLRLEINEYSVIDTKKRKTGGFKMPAIESWLEAILRADYVITDSFHGVVFSIIFNKPFIVYANKERGIERFYTLLKHFGLENRMVDSIEACDGIMDRVINWDLVNERLEKMKEHSVNFLLMSCNIK